MWSAAIGLNSCMHVVRGGWLQVLSELVHSGHAEWEDAAQTSCLILYRKTADWAKASARQVLSMDRRQLIGNLQQEIHRWAVRHGMKDQVLTVLELQGPCQHKLFLLTRPCRHLDLLNPFALVDGDLSQDAPFCKLDIQVALKTTHEWLVTCHEASDNENYT